VINGTSCLVDFDGVTELAYSQARVHVDNIVHAQWRNESGIWWIMP